MPTAHSHDAEIYYEVHGGESAALPVVFAHGAGGNRVSWWQQVPLFASTRRVLTFDHRCFGRSRCTPEHFQPQYFADDLFAILDVAELPRVAVVCQSMGGWTGLRAAVERPERVACLVLAGTPGGLDTQAVRAAMAGIGQRISDAGVVANAALAPSYPAREPAMAHLYEQISALNTGVDPGTLARLMAPEARIQPEQLEGYSVPTLVVAGELDLLFPVAALREVAQLIPNAELAELEGAGHSAYFEQADVFNARLEDFVAKHATC
jgi:3-oxoadipate enol-lactonase